MSGQASRVLPIATTAMDAFIARPVQLFEVPACEILRGVDRARRDANKPMRLRIEAMLDRLEDLRQRLITRLDAMDGDTDLEPFLSALERFDQRTWASGPSDDREDDGDAEPYLSASELLNQRLWSAGGAHDREGAHDGREPEDHA